MGKEDIKATFITIERPLIPKPPRNSRPYWCYGNTLMFKEKDGTRTLWEQEIPEAKLLWCKANRNDPSRERQDTFETYGSCEVFLDKHFGWQLRVVISHERAKDCLKRILEYNRRYHAKHFKE